MSSIKRSHKVFFKLHVLTLTPYFLSQSWRLFKIVLLRKHKNVVDPLECTKNVIFAFIFILN